MAVAGLLNGCSRATFNGCSRATLQAVTTQLLAAIFDYISEWYQVNPVSVSSVGKPHNPHGIRVSKLKSLQ
jgi:hypothetical protein